MVIEAYTPVLFPIMHCQHGVAKLPSRTLPLPPSAAGRSAYTGTVKAWREAAVAELARREGQNRCVLGAAARDLRSHVSRWNIDVVAHAAAAESHRARAGLAHLGRGALLLLVVTPFLTAPAVLTAASCRPGLILRSRVLYACPRSLL